MASALLILQSVTGVNPLPAPGIPSAPSVGRRGTPAAAQAAPVVPWSRPAAPRDRLSVNNNSSQWDRASRTPPREFWAATCKALRRRHRAFSSGEP